jgi:hypothetical protein
MVTLCTYPTPGEFEYVRVTVEFPEAGTYKKSNTKLLKKMSSNLSYATGVPFRVYWRDAGVIPTADVINGTMGVLPANIT